MANQPWLDEVQRQLAENGLPPSYIRRFMDELADHLEDLMEETMSKETNHFGSVLPHRRANTFPAKHDGRNETDHLSQLGEPSEIANAATVAYRQRTFFGRHPVAKFLVFGVSPIPVMILTLCVVFPSIMLLDELTKIVGLFPYLENYFRSSDPLTLKWAASIITLMLPTMLLAVSYCKLARRSNLSRTWMLISCSMLAIIPMLLFYQVTISDIPGESALHVGAAFGPHMLHPSILQYTQLFVPLAVGLWFMRRTRKEPTETNQKESLQAAA